MNITLSVPPAIVQDARELAESRNTSLNRMIRDFLMNAVESAKRKREREVDDFFDFAMGLDGGGLPKGYRFTRADAYED